MLWGAIGGLASIMPVVGAPLVWVPVVIAYIFLGSLLEGANSGTLGCVDSRLP